MPESDILLSIDGDTTPLKGSLKNTLKWANKEAAVYMSMVGKTINITKGIKLPKISPITDSFAHFKKTRGRMRGMDIEKSPLPKIPTIEQISPGRKSLLSKEGRYEKFGLGKKSDDPIKKSVFGAFKGVAKLYKIDLYWRWIKGTWNSMVRNNALLKALGSIFDAAINLLGMALLLPIFKPLLAAVVWLLQKSVDFFNYMRSLEGLSPSKFAEKIVADINKLFTDTDWAAYGNKIGTAIQNTVDFVDKFIKGLNWETIGTSFGTFVNGVIDKFDGSTIGKTIGNAVNGAIKFLTGMFKEVNWTKFGTEIGNAIGDLIKTINWVDIGTLIANSIWASLKALWGIGIGIGTKAREGEKFNVDEWFTKKFTEIFKPRDSGLMSKETMGIEREKFISEDPIISQAFSTNVTVSGLVDEQKFRSIIRDEINRSQSRLSKNRGAVSI